MVYYSEYLQLSNLLNAQQLESEKNGKPAHDEMLFIIIHQTYELWFKQILFELSAVQSIFDRPKVEENTIPVAIHHFSRVIEILKVLVQQIDIMETMAPLDFLDFRDYLVPASGFQSVQFRLFEAKLGMTNDKRLDIEKKFFNSRLKPEDVKKVEDEEKRKSLVILVQEWLERMPFAHSSNYNYWNDFEKVIETQLKNEQNLIEKNSTLNPDQKMMELKNLEFTKMNYQSLFEQKVHDEMVKIGKRKLSRNGMLNALFIHLHQHEPLLQSPFQLLTKIVEIEEQVTLWRYRHAMMAHRLLGGKIGTGGSSGHDYLKASAENSRVFVDLFNLTSFLIPRSMIPALPKEIHQSLTFRYGSAADRVNS